MILSSRSVALLDRLDIVVRNVLSSQTKRNTQARLNRIEPLRDV